MFLKNKSTWHQQNFQVNFIATPPGKPVENVAPLLKRKEKQKQKVTLMHPSSNFQIYKLTQIFRRGVEPHSNIKLCPM
jgi:hypothetical protein